MAAIIRSIETMFLMDVFDYREGFEELGAFEGLGELNGELALAVAAGVEEAF